MAGSRHKMGNLIAAAERASLLLHGLLDCERCTKSERCEDCQKIAPVLGRLDAALSRLEKPQPDQIGRKGCKIAFLRLFLK